jgi:hypothetical protein
MEISSPNPTSRSRWHCRIHCGRRQASNFPAAALQQTGPEKALAPAASCPVLPYGSHTRSSAVATVETPGSVRNAASSPDRSTARAFSERVRLTARRRDNRDVLFAPGRIRSYGTGARTHASTFFFTKLYWTRVASLLAPAWFTRVRESSLKSSACLRDHENG